MQQKLIKSHAVTDKDSLVEFRVLYLRFCDNYIDEEKWNNMFSEHV